MNKTWPAREIIKECCRCHKSYDDCTKPFGCESAGAKMEESTWYCYDCAPGYVKFLEQAEADGR